MYGLEAKQRESIVAVVLEVQERRDNENPTHFVHDWDKDKRIPTQSNEILGVKEQPYTTENKLYNA